MIRILILLVSLFCLTAFNNRVETAQEELLRIESEEILQRSKKIANLYQLPEDSNLFEITDRILNSDVVLDEQKALILATGRRIFLFTYPSDGLNIKGVINFAPQPEENPLMVVLRGGNREFAVVNPGSKLMTLNNYTVVTTTYRDGFSEGVDEFGGADVNDVKNLIDYIPTLEQKLDQNFHQHRFLLGTSRGGMQMFLSLARFPELQAQFAKIVSLSGLLDIRENMRNRNDMRQMFIDDFGLVPGINEEEWLDQRDPLLAAEKIDSRLPIIILQGTADNRVGLNEGYHMIEKLQSQGNTVEYFEFDGGDHCLGNVPDFMETLVSILEN